MKILKNSYFLIALLSGVFSLQADFIDVSVWKRSGTAGDDGLLVLCEDLHEPAHKGLDQAKAIVDLLATYSRATDTLIVEDMFDIKGFAQRVERFFDGHPHEADRAKALRGTNKVHEIYEERRKESVEQGKQDALFSLPYLANEQNIPLINADFREFISTDSPRFNIEAYEEGNEIIPVLLEQLVDEIAAFNDGAFLNKMYAASIKRFRPFMQYICKIMRENKITFQELPTYFVNYCVEHADTFDVDLMKCADTESFNMMYYNLQQALGYLKDNKDSAQIHNDLLWIFSELLNLSSGELVDAMFMHALYEKQVKNASGNTVFICAGKSHTQTIQSVLSDLGYKIVDSATDTNGVDVKKVCEAHLKKYEKSEFLAIAYSVVDGVKSAINAVGSFLGLV